MSPTTAVLDAMNCAVDDPVEGVVALPELAARLCAGAVAISASTAAWLLLVAEFDRREGWAVPGVASCAHWLSWQCGIAPGTAREHVRLARALPGLPGVTEELGAGRLSYAKARAIARVADAETESDLLDLAQHCTAAQLDRVVAGWRRADAVSTDLARARADEARAAARTGVLAEGGSDDAADAAGRSAAAAVWTAWWPEGADPDVLPAGWEHRFDWHDEGDGSVTLRLRLSAEEAAEVIAGVEQRAEVLTRRERIARSGASAGEDGDPVEDGEAVEDGDVAPTDWASWTAGHDLPGVRGAAGRGREIAAARRARVTVARTTAFLDLVRAGVLSVDTRPGDPARRELLVRVDAAVLAEDTAAGQAAIDGVAALSPSQVRRLACDAAVTAVLVEHGQVLACGRTRRYASSAQRRALLLRDGGCARPGCTETRPERLHAHHLVSWLAGGRTDVDNLVLLCDRCHGLVHDLDVTLHRDDGRLHARKTDGSTIWTTPQVSAHAEPPDVHAPAETGAETQWPPYWEANGARMDLRYVVGTILQNRAVLRRRQMAQGAAA